MKKLKFLLPLILALAMALTIPFAAACKKKDKNSYELISISLDTSHVKQQYLRGDGFTSEGLVVNATIKRAKSNDTEVSNVTDSATVDSSAFVNTSYGTYAIKVSYSLFGTTKEAEYNVSVVETVFEGLKVTFSDDTDIKTVPLSATMSTASIDPFDLKVQRADAFGVIGEPLKTSEYTFDLWKENKKVEDSYLDNGIYKNLTGGVYQLWAYAESYEGNESYQLKGFAIIIVADKVTSLTVDLNGHNTQELGLDKISSKWTYSVTYISGATKTVTNSDVTFNNFNTKLEATGKTARVTYTEVNAAGESSQAYCDIQYSITPSSLSSLPKQSFIVKNVSDASNKFATVVPTDSDGIGGEIEDNGLFILTTQGEMKWAEAKGSATSVNTKWITTTLQDGSSITFDEGLSQSTTTAGGEETPTLTFKAKTDINLKAYLTLCNAPYNSNRPGTLIAKITHADGSVTSRQITGVGAKREEMSDLTFDLYEGDVLVISIKNTGASTATMWLFGAEATGYKSVGEGN